MKKYISYFCSLVLALVCVVVPCFASQTVLPMLPESDKEYWTIVLYEGTYKAYNTDTQPTTKDYPDQAYQKRPTVYELVDGVWVDTAFVGGGQNIFIDSIIYDNTGIFATNSLAIFGIKERTKFKDFQETLTAFTSQISVSSVVEILVVLAGACVGLAFMWWGVRKLVRASMTAFKKGRVKL